MEYTRRSTVSHLQLQTRYRTYNVTWTTGKIYFFHSIDIYRETYRLLFQVDKRLTLNMTFLIINFFKAPGECDHNRLEVVKSGKSFCALNRNAEYTYCKHYSAFNLFPKFNLLYLQLEDSFILLPFELNALFSVVDNNFITTEFTRLDETITTLIPNFSTMSIFHNYNINTPIHYLLISYLIQVRKHYNIVFLLEYFSKSNFKIYDGPGFTFPLLKTDKVVFITSAFQCITQFFLEEFNTTVNAFVSYSTKTAEISRQLTIREKEMHFKYPVEYCLNILCIFSIETNAGHQVNVTIVSISSSAKHSDCLLWGLVTLEDSDNNYQESVSKCWDQDVGSSSNINFYSLNSKLILILYNYQDASQIKVSGFISRTKCKPATFRSMFIFSFIL